MKYMKKITRMYKLKELRARYKKAIKNEKTNILDEFCLNFGYSRKHAVTILTSKELDINKSISCKKRGPKRKYNPDEIIPILKAIWFASDQACSKKIESLIPYWLPHYEALNGSLAGLSHVQITNYKNISIKSMYYYGSKAQESG